MSSPAAIRADQPLFVAVTAELLDTGLAVRFRARGTSMRPAIEDGDLMTVAPVDEAAIRIGDVVLFRQGQRPIAHRVRRIVAGGPGRVALVLRGDANGADDAPIEPAQVLGRVVAIERRRQPDFVSRWWTRMRGRRPKWLMADGDGQC